MLVKELRMEEGEAPDNTCADPHEHLETNQGHRAEIFVGLILEEGCNASQNHQATQTEARPGQTMG